MRRRISFLAFFLIWADFKGWTVPPLHVEICDWLERFHRSGRLGVLEVFRGAAKSTIVAVFQAWILYTDGTFRLLDQAADDRVARRLSRDTRGVLRKHPLCRGMLPRDDQAVESINVVSNPDERNPSVSAHGVLSNVTSARADGVVFDDVEVPRNIRSDEARELLRDRMQESVHILVPGGWRLLIGTPHTHDSIYDEHTARGALTLKIPLFAHHVRYEADIAERQRAFPYNFPGVNRADLFVFLGGTRGGRLLVDGVDYKVDRGAVLFNAPPGRLVDIYAGSAWPERFTREEIAARRAECRSLNAWDSQYLLHAKPLHQIRLDPDRLCLYNVEPTITFANGEARMMLGTARIVGASTWWDCALGKVKSDASALSVVLTDERGVLYWHVCRALEGDVYAQCRSVREVVTRLHLAGVTVEVNGPGGHVPAILRQQLAGLECGVVEHFEHTNKDQRILDAIEPPLSGRYLWAHVDALDAFESQMRDWQPGVQGQKDDFLDSGAGAIRQTPIRIAKIRHPVERVERADWRPDAGDHEITFGR